MGAHYKGRCAGPSEGPRHAACGPSDEEAQTHLEANIETRIRRTNLPVGKNGSRIVVSLDEGEVRAERKSISAGEVELELREVNPVSCSSWRD